MQRPDCRAIAGIALLILGIVVMAVEGTPEPPTLFNPEDLQSIAIVGVHAFNEAENPSTWPSVFSQYHLQFLDRTTAFTNSRRIHHGYIEQAHRFGLLTASYFSQDPAQGPEWGFRQAYYEELAQDQLWRYANGALAYDPYENSACRNVLGEIIRYDDDDGRVMMSECSPYWLGYQKDTIAWALEHGLDAIDVDLIIPCPLSMGGDFSDWSVNGFREHLTNSYPADTLASWGIEDVAAFDVQQYFLGSVWGGTIVQEHPRTSQPYFSTEPQDLPFSDPVVREFHKYGYLSHIEYYAELSEHTHALGEESGRFVPIFGNLRIGEGAGASGNSQLSVVLGRVVDIIQSETIPAVPPAERLTTISALGLAMADYHKPVWNLHAPFYEGYYQNRDDIPRDSSLTTLLQLYLAETYAAGVIPEIDLGGWPGVPHPRGLFLDGDQPIPEIRTYLDFVWTHRELIRGDVESTGRVAIVYSIPSFMWHHAPLFDTWPGDQEASFDGYARALEHAHIPYDVLIFGHPDFWDDQDALKRLMQYSVVILAHVDCMSDDQAMAVKSFVKRGGTLVTVGDYWTDVGTRTEDYERRGEPALSSLLWDYGQGEVVSISRETA